MSKKNIIFLILAIAWMVLIFYFSAQTAEESTGQSDGVSFIIGNIIYKDFDSWSNERKAAFADSVSSVVRKAAHMTEYGILCLLWYGALSGCGLKRESEGPDDGSGGITIGKLAMPFVITVIYAATDEFHQRFVTGRTGKISDVFIDACGALIVCAVIAVIMLIKSRKVSKALPSAQK